MSRITAFIIGGLAGALAGVCAGVLIAPRSGADTRFVMAQKAGSLAGDIESFAGDIPNNVMSLVQKPSGEKAESTDTEELREKIEAARKRIAAEAAKAEAEKAGA